jgi:hypothetical protein
MKRLHELSLIALAAVLPMAVLTGCGTGMGTDGKSPATGKAKVGQGQVLGGQQPVQGIAIQIYAVSSSGYGAAATPLLTPNATTTSANGNFTFSAYTCPQNDPLVYVVGTGGKVIPAGGVGAAVTNSNLAMMVGVGHCSTLASQYLYLNELTTVASVWALAPFMTDYAHVGTSATNAVGLTNAFAAINKLVNISNGTLSGPALPSNATLPLSEMNTIADILQQCVNSSGGSASDSTDGHTNGTNCGKLFFLTKTTSVTPADTIAAALSMAQNPAQNVALLNDLRSATPPFSPFLDVNSPPSAWTLAISYSGGGLSAPKAITTDQSGNVWVANSSSVSLFSSSGAAVSGSSGFTAGGISSPSGIAVDSSGLLWVANAGSSKVSTLTTGGTGTSVSGTSLNAPPAIALDAAGDAWLANANNSLMEFTNGGNPATNAPFSGGGVSSPQAVAIAPK